MDDKKIGQSSDDAITGGLNPFVIKKTMIEENLKCLAFKSLLQKVEISFEGKRQFIFY